LRVAAGGRKRKSKVKSQSAKLGNINSKQNLFTATPPYLPKVTPNHYSTKEPTQIQSKSELRFRNLLTFINCCCIIPADDLENQTPSGFGRLQWL